MNKKVYLALDQSLNISGYAFFSEKGSLLEKGTFSCPAKYPIEQRLYNIMKEVTELINEYSSDYEVVVFLEDIQNQNNISTYKKLAFVQATILLTCFFEKCDYMVISPSHWRRIIKEKYGIAFGRKREEQKENAIAFVNEHFKIKATSDEADAICLGCAGIIEYRNTKGAW